MREDQFKRSLFETHKDHFGHLIELQRLAQDSVSKYDGFITNHYERALVLIFPRAYKSFDSVRRLCEVASCEDAAIILRSLLNLLVVTRWISLDQQKRARKYLGWHWIDLNRELEDRPASVPSAFAADIRRHYTVVAPQYEYQDKRGLNRMAKQWYEPEAYSILDMFKQVGLEKQYEEGYRPLSGIEHSDVTAFFAMIAQAEKIGDARKLEIQSDFFVPHYLRNAFQWFGDIFRICNKTIPLADGKELERVVSAGMKFYEEDLLARTSSLP